MKRDENGARVLRMLEVGAGIYLAGFFAWAYWTKRHHWLSGLAVGGAIALANFRFMQWYCRKLIAGQKVPGKNQMLGLMSLKTGFPLLMIGGAIFLLDLHPVAVAVGLSSIVAAVLGYAGYLAAQQLIHPEKE